MNDDHKVNFQRLILQSAVHLAAAAPSTDGTANPLPPPSFGQLEGATGPQARRRRSCCCLWVMFSVILIILLAAVGGVYLRSVYWSHRPYFSLASIDIQTLNHTSSNTLDANFILAVVPANPEKGVVFYYDPITVTITSNGDSVTLGAGSFPSFRLGTEDATVVKGEVVGRGLPLDELATGMPLTIKLETKVTEKMRALTSPKVMTRNTCEGMNAVMSAGKKLSLVTSAAQCKVDWTIKLWKFTLLSSSEVIGH